MPLTKPFGISSSRRWLPSLPAAPDVDWGMPSHAGQAPLRGRPLLRFCSVSQGQPVVFGMKAHIGVEKESGLIHSVATTGANVHDVTMSEELLHINAQERGDGRPGRGVLDCHETGTGPPAASSRSRRAITVGNHEKSPLSRLERSAGLGNPSPQRACSWREASHVGSSSNFSWHP